MPSQEYLRNAKPRHALYSLPASVPSSTSFVKTKALITIPRRSWREPETSSEYKRNVGTRLVWSCHRGRQQASIDLWLSRITVEPLLPNACTAKSGELLYSANTGAHSVEDFRQTKHALSQKSTVIHDMVSDEFNIMPLSRFGLREPSIEREPRLKTKLERGP